MLIDIVAQVQTQHTKTSLNHVDLLVAMGEYQFLPYKK